MVKVIKLILVLGLIIGAVYLYVSIKGSKFLNIGKEMQRESIDVVVGADTMEKNAEKAREKAQDSIRSNELIANAVSQGKD